MVNRCWRKLPPNYKCDVQEIRAKQSRTDNADNAEQNDDRIFLIAKKYNRHRHAGD